MKKGLIVILIIFYFQNVLAQQNKTVDSSITKTDTAVNLQQALNDTSILSSNTVNSSSSTKKNSVENLQQNQKDTFTALHTKFEDPSVNSPYHTSFVKDGLVIAASVGVTLLGYNLIKNKNDLTPEELATKTKSSVPFYDRPGGIPVGLIWGEMQIVPGEKSSDGKYTKVWTQPDMHVEGAAIIPYTLKTLRSCG